MCAGHFDNVGYPGIRKLGKVFNNTMQKLGVDINIEVNQFQDNELPRRSVDELTEVYSTVFDELHGILLHELGRGMGHLAFSFGIDLLPWQTREVVAELILSRLD